MVWLQRSGKYANSLWGSTYLSCMELVKLSEIV
jgi:hypothetical protein